MELKDDNPEVFQAFFHWVYTGKLYFALDASGEVPLDFPSSTRSTFSVMLAGLLIYAMPLSTFLFKR